MVEAESRWVLKEIKSNIFISLKKKFSSISNGIFRPCENSDSGIVINGDEVNWEIDSVSQDLKILLL